MVAQHLSVLFTGPTGIGKSWLARALAQKACRDGYTVWYRPVPKLFRDLTIARADGSLGRLLETIARTDVLVVDDFAMAPLNEQERRDFLEICDDRYNRRSTILTSQLPVASCQLAVGWGRVSWCSLTTGQWLPSAARGRGRRDRPSPQPWSASGPRHVPSRRAANPSARYRSAGSSLRS